MATGSAWPFAAAPPPNAPVNPLDHSVVLTQVAMFVGAVFSIASIIFTVVVKYCRFQSVRRPPLSLLFWRSISDLIFASQFLITLFVQLSVSRETSGGIFWGRFPEYRPLCKLMAFTTQFFAFASEMWLCMICVDLVLSLTQPFRPLSSSNPTYHAVVWLSSLCTAWLLLALNFDGPSPIHICWVMTDNTSFAALPDAECSDAKWTWTATTRANWWLFYGWVIAISIFCVLVFIYASVRLSEGLQATYEVRRDTIKDLRLYVFTGLGYWMVAASSYLALTLQCYPDWTGLRPGQEGSAVLWIFMGMTIGLKGLVDALLWNATARRIVEQQLTRASVAGNADGHGHGGGCDAPFGVPEALREEWLDYTQLGIRTAIQAAEEAAGSPHDLQPKRVLMLPSIREPSLSTAASRQNSSTSRNELPRPLSRGGSGMGAAAIAIGGGGGGSGSWPLPTIAADVGGGGASAGSGCLGGPAAGGGGGGGGAGLSMATPMLGGGAESARATELDPSEREPCCAAGCVSRRLQACWARFTVWVMGGGPPFAFTEYHPGDFLRLRRESGVSSEQYLSSLLSEGQVWVKRQKEGKGGRWRFSEGRSGSFMYYTNDRKLLVKTIDAAEAAVLRSHASAYCRYMVAHPHSYLSRVFGTYSITMYNTTVHFVVMSNIFAAAIERPLGEPFMDERYDLKGSWVDRNSSRPKDPNTVKKDNDLNYCLHLSSDRLECVQAQMSADVAFLSQELHVMDYSLLVGVRRGRFIVNPDDGTQFVPGSSAPPPPVAPPVAPPPPAAQRLSSAHEAPGGSPQPQPTSTPGAALAEAVVAAAPKQLAKETSSCTGVSPSLRNSMSGASMFVGTASPLSGGGGGLMPRLSLSTGASQRASTSDDVQGGGGGRLQLTEPSANGAGGGGAKDGAATTTTLRSPDVLPLMGATTAPPAVPSPGISGGGMRMVSEAAGSGGSAAGIERASIVEGPQTYHMGIIDMLQPWSMSKRLERFAKTYLRCSNAHGISAVPPAEYARRFTERVIYDIFDAPMLPEQNDDCGNDGYDAARPSVV